VDVADHSRSPRRHNAFQRLLALNGALFYKGNLAELLLAANIVEREEPIQQKLGTAVAIRAMRDTVLVRIEEYRPARFPTHLSNGLCTTGVASSTGCSSTRAATLERPWAVRNVAYQDAPPSTL
jgi:hypothetical protein